MTTRMELWKTYRDEIERNIALQSAVQQSDEQLVILKKRLIKLLPDYESLYPSKLSVFKAKVESVEAAPQYDFSRLETLVANFAFFEDSLSNINLLSQLSFSSHELDEVIMKIKKGKSINLDYVEPSDVTKERTKPSLQKVSVSNGAQKLRIAIDGPSGSGKSTVAKIIAKKHGLNYINTGLIYRAVALYALNARVEPKDEAQIKKFLRPELVVLKPGEVVILNGKDVTNQLRSDIVSQAASRFAAIPMVRAFALRIAQQYAEVPGTIMDGRDTTFRIMPNANLKIFLDTAPEVRAQRRVDENKQLGYETNYQTILAEIKERDHRDRTRPTDPLHQTADAHLIDASKLTIDQVVAKVELLISKVLNE